MLVQSSWWSLFLNTELGDFCIAAHMYYLLCHLHIQGSLLMLLLWLCSSTDLGIPYAVHL